MGCVHEEAGEDGVCWSCWTGADAADAADEVDGTLKKGLNKGMDRFGLLPDSIQVEAGAMAGEAGERDSERLEVAAGFLRVTGTLKDSKEGLDAGGGMFEAGNGARPAVTGSRLGRSFGCVLRVDLCFPRTGLTCDGSRQTLRNDRDASRSTRR